MAINNVPIRSERQVVRFLQQTMGDLMVLVERTLDDVEDIDMRGEHFQNFKFYPILEALFFLNCTIKRISLFSILTCS